MNVSLPVRIAFAGSVTSSRRTLEGLLRHGANIVGVLGLRADAAGSVSGYCRFDDLAEKASAEYVDFELINEPSILRKIREWQPDVLFVPGLSQLLSEKLLEIPRLGSVGFHPTRLPEGRGRAPIAWLTLQNRGGAATFFLMEAEADSGPIFVQEFFDVSAEDYAKDVLAKTEQAIDRALDRWLPRLLSGEWNPQPQNHARATFFGRRSPTDGLINWEHSAEDIYALVRASSRPHPGAYTYCRGQKIIVWCAEIERRLPITGVIGRIVESNDDNRFLVQTGNGLLWLTEVKAEKVEAMPRLRVGMKLGLSAQDELSKMKQSLADLQKRIVVLENSARVPRP